MLPICGDVEIEYIFCFTVIYAYIHVKEISFYKKIDKDFSDCTDKEKSFYLFKQYTRKLAKYVCKIFNKRRERLYDVRM